MNIYYSETEWEKEKNCDATVKEIIVFRPHEIEGHKFTRYQASIAITGLDKKNNPDKLDELYRVKKLQSLLAMKDYIERTENLKDIVLIEGENATTD